MSRVVVILEDGTKLGIARAVGPGTNTTVAAGSSGTVTLSYQIGELGEILDALAVKNISGLPDGVAIEGVSVDRAGVTLKVRNTTGGDITITANSVAAEVLVRTL